MVEDVACQVSRLIKSNHTKLGDCVLHCCADWVISYSDLCIVLRNPSLLSAYQHLLQSTRFQPMSYHAKPNTTDGLSLILQHQQ